jgi:hypothetical protein
MYRRIGCTTIDPDREAQRAEEKAERREEAKAERAAPAPTKDPMDFDGLDANDDEFGSVEDFAEWLVDDDREEFDHRELQCLNYRLNVSVPSLRKRLESWGFSLAKRGQQRRIRGFNANNHDRWFGPGSDATHGGSGF